MKTNQKQLLLRILNELYPDAKSELNFRNDYQMVVCVLLSAQCTDKKVNEVTPALFRVCPGFRHLGQIELSRLEQIIRPINYYKTKAKNLINMASMVVQDFKGQLPESLELLTKLPGVGRKTANVVLCEQGRVPALPVDTHVQRLSNRLGLSTETKPDKVEEDLTKQFPPETWRRLHHSLILHGRRVCKARRPMCAGCRLAELCPSAGKC